MATNDAIGTSLYVDYSDFASGLAEANRLIKLNKQQFETAAASMDDWNKTQEGLAAKVKSLNSIFTLQSNKVAAMEREYEKIKEQYGENSKAAQNYAIKLEKERTTLAQTEKSLEKYKKKQAELENELRDGTRAVDRQTEAAEENADANDNAADSAGGLGGAFKSLLSANLVASAIGAVTSALGGMISGFLGAAEATKEYRMNLAKVSETAKATGASFDDAKENMLSMAAVSGEVDAAGEAINNLMAAGLKGDNLDKITEQLTGASIKWKDTLKLEGLADGLQETLATNSAIGPFAELLERGGRSLESFNARLAACSTEAEKQNLIMSELSAMGLEDIAASYKENNAALYEAELAQLRYNDTMAQVGSAFEPINTMITNMKTNMLSAFLPAIKKITSAITLFGENSTKAGKMLVSGFGDILRTVGQKIAATGQTIISAAINIVPQLLSKLSAALPHVVALVADYLTLAFMQFTNFAPKISQSVSNFLVGLVGVIQKGFYTILEKLPSYIEGYISAFASYGTIFYDTVAAWYTALGDAIPEAVEKLKARLPDIVNAVTNALKNSIPKVVASASNMFSSLITALKKIIPSLASSLPSIFNAISKALKEWAPLLASGAFELFKNIITGIISFIPVLVKSLPQIISAIVSGIKTLAGTIIQLGADLLRWLWDGTAGARSWLVEKVKGIGEWFSSGFESVKTKIKEIGVNLVKGLWSGIASVKDWIIDKLGGFTDSVLGAVRDFFGVHSPSREFKEIGEYCGKGFGEGIAENKDGVAGAKEFSKSTMDALKKDIAHHRAELAKLLGLTVQQASGDATQQAAAAGQSVADSYNASLDSGLNGVESELAAVEKGSNAIGDTLQGVISEVFSESNLSSLCEGDWKSFAVSLGSTLANTLSSYVQSALSSASSSGSSVGGSVAGGASSGAAVGGIWGAVIGGAIGLVGSLLSRKSSKTQKTTGYATGSSSYNYMFNDEQYTELAGAITDLTDTIKADKERVSQIIFNQTNTSPKALNSAEVYRQTNKAVNLLNVARA